MKCPLVALLIGFVPICQGYSQHADVRPYVMDGRIHTAGYIDTTSTEVPGLRVFGYEFGEDPDLPYLAQDPGFSASGESGLPPGSELLFNIVGANDTLLPGNLSFWDGTGDVAFVVAPAGETLTLSFGGQYRTVDHSTSLVAGFRLQTVSPSGAVHRHLTTQLNGSSSEPSSGIYLIDIELLSSDISIDKSLPIFIIYNNGLEESQHDQAIEWVELNFVQQPSPGDFDGDGDVDGRDFLAWQRGDSPNPLSAGDLAVWQANFGQGSLAAMNVPEPGIAVFLGAALVSSLTQRRKRLCKSIKRSADYCRPVAQVLGSLAARD